jgi:hypothetical protein
LDQLSDIWLMYKKDAGLKIYLQGNHCTTRCLLVTCNAVCVPTDKHTYVEYKRLKTGVEENNYMFRPSSGWAIIRLKVEYRRKLIYYNVDIKNGGTRSRFTVFGEVCSSIYRVYSCFLQQFENTVVLRRTFIYLISTIPEDRCL